MAKWRILKDFEDYDCLLFNDKGMDILIDERKNDYYIEYFNYMKEWENYED